MSADAASTAAVPRRVIGPYDRVVMAGVEYRGGGSDEVGHTLVRTDASEAAEGFTHEAYHRARGVPGFRYDRGYYEPGKVKARHLAGVASLTHLAPWERSQILWRLEWVRAAMRDADAGEGSRSDEGLRAVVRRHRVRIAGLDCARLGSEAGSARNAPRRATAAARSKARAGRVLMIRQPPAPKALRTWIKRFEEGGCDPLALRKRTYRSGYRRAHFDPEVHLALQVVACRYATRTRPKIRRLHEDLLIAVAAINERRQGEGRPPVACPSLKALSKVIAGLSKFEVYAGRHGLEAARRRFQVVSYGPDVSRPFERIEIDEWTVDLQKLAVESGVWEHMAPQMREKVTRVRYALCAALDGASRCYVGLSLRPTACVENAMQALHMACVDKTPYARAVGAATPWDMYGGLEMVVTDTGASFVDENFQSGVLALGGEPYMPPTGLPHLRGMIERGFGSLRTRLAGRFTGQTHEHVVAKGDYDPLTDASLTVGEWAEVMVRHAVDHYHNWPHEALGGDTPRNRWVELNRTVGTTDAPDRHTLREVFGIRLRRTVGGHGVRVMGLRYNAERLQTFFRAAGPVEVDVRVDPLDLGYVSAFIEGGWLTLRCHREAFDGVAVDAWLRASEDLRRRYADLARVSLPVALAAIRDIQAISDAAVVRAGIAALAPTSEALDRLDRQMGIAFELPPDPVAEVGADAGPGDPLLGGFATGGPVGDPDVPPGPPDRPTPPPPRRRFRMSDK